MYLEILMRESAPEEVKKKNVHIKRPLNVQRSKIEWMKEIL